MDINKKPSSHRLVILTGPSCAGKTPLASCMRLYYPAVMENLSPLVLYNSRDPRRCEEDGKDYHFRSAHEIQRLRPQKRYIVLEARGGLQAIDLYSLKSGLESSDMFYEGNTYSALKLLDYAATEMIPLCSVFLSPLSRDEVLRLGARDAAAFVFTLMKEKLLRRHNRQNPDPDNIDMANINLRASEAFSEILLAWRFDFVLPNHVGEDRGTWDTGNFPAGEAGHVLRRFADMVSAGGSEGFEKWTEHEFRKFR